MPRADEAGGLYHALNRGNLRADIFKKEADFDAFERLLHEALQIHDIELYGFQLMSNHYHLVLRPLVDGDMSRFMGWVGGTHTMRYHAHYRTSGQGHVYQQRYKSFPIQDDDHFLTVCRYVERNALRAGLVRRAEDWKWGSLWRWLQNQEPDPPLLSPWPLPRLPRWQERVNRPLGKQELDALRLSVQRGRPFGTESWTESIARRLNLESTMRPRGRPRVRPPKETPNKEAPLMSRRIRDLPRRSDCRRPERPAAAWDSHSLEIAGFHGVPFFDPAGLWLCGNARHRLFK